MRTEKEIIEMYKKYEKHYNKDLEDIDPVDKLSMCTKLITLGWVLGEINEIHTELDW